MTDQSHTPHDYATSGVPMDVASVLKRARETLAIGRAAVHDTKRERLNWRGHADLVEQQITACLESLTSEKPPLPDYPTGAMLALIAGEDCDPPLMNRDQALVRYHALRALCRRGDGK